ncbi:LysR family transcriptional regulator [Roseibium sp.]|uniref:LysR family transcriptional regulator n=1 Tax=Roseibium sp. TaxID=1936156 RepID=UPI0032672C63
MKSLSWDLYQDFIAVARKGGLSAAASATGMSAATLGRRMLELEQGLGKVLFHRSPSGYELTGDGLALLDHLKDLEAAARKVDSWQGVSTGNVIVRIAVGTWIAHLLSENFEALRTLRDDFRVDLRIGEQRAGLAFRENDIGIRAFAPEETNLASRLTGSVAYAAYRARNSAESTRDTWLAVAEDDAVSPYLRWPHENHPDKVRVTVNRPRNLKDLALSGAGIAVLPCLAGDLEPGLERAGPEIAELRHQQWIVMSDDDRHRREIRTVVSRLARLIKQHGDLISGARPSRSV